jgi:hypothetical protein
VPDILTLTRVSNLTTNGFVKTGSANGTLSVDTSAYLTGNQSIALSGDITGSGSTAITTSYNGAVPLNKGGLPTGGATGQYLSKNSGTNYDAIWKTVSGATLQTVSAGNAPGTSSTTGVMAGYGTTSYLTPAALITPVRSGLVLVTFSGIMSNNTTNAITGFDIRYGTGTPPVNGAAATGTVAGPATQAHIYSANIYLPFSLSAMITGLTLNTQYWLDMRQVVASGTGSLLSVTCSAFELP